MRTGKVVLVMLAVLAMAGAAGAQCIPADPPGGDTPAYVPCDGNLIVNGDFEETDGTMLGFTSGYRPYLQKDPTDLGFTVPGTCLQATGCSNDNMWCEGVWVIGRNPANYHQLWYNDFKVDGIGVGDFGDHTTNRGNMLILNGATTPGTIVWRQTVSGISANTEYTFSFWARSAYLAAPPILTVTANGEPLSLVPVTLVAREWQKVTYTWQSGVATAVTFEIANSVTDASGNDYALDDLELCYAGPPPCPVQSEPLCAGQTMDIGTVDVTNDDENLYVTFNIDTENWPGWYLDETHVAIGESLNDIPQTGGRNPNPIPGQFPYFCENLEPAQTSCTVTIPLDGWCAGTELVVAAHAAVVEVEGDGCVEKIFWANIIDSYDQGTRKDGSDVLPERSDPSAVFALGGPFFSLGFDLIADDDYADGWLRVGFGASVYNGLGDDVVVQEITNGRSTYPLEQVEVFGVADDMLYSAGIFDNEKNVPGGDGFVSIGLPPGPTSFDFIELLDATNPGLHTKEADGYDVDAVGACYLVVGDETAWGDGCEGTRFTPRGNWGTYFTYNIGECAPCVENE